MDAGALMQPAPESSRTKTQPAVSVGRLPVIQYDTEEFREGSVRILAEACASGPVCRVLPHDIPGLLRFRDVDAVLRDPLTFSSKTRLLTPPSGTGSLSALIGDDPPDHTRLRALFGQAFTAARVSETMAPRVLAIARELVQKILDGGREFDLVRDLAVPPAGDRDLRAAGRRRCRHDRLQAVVESRSREVFSSRRCPRAQGRPREWQPFTRASGSWTRT